MDRRALGDEGYCFAIRQATRYLTQLYEQHLAPGGLTITQYTILRKLDRKPAMTMAELSRRMVLDRTTLVRVLQPMQRDGLVLTQRIGAGVRAARLVLSPQGAARYRAAVPLWQAAQQAFEARFGVQRAQVLRQTLFEMTEMDWVRSTAAKASDLQIEDA